MIFERSKIYIPGDIVKKVSKIYQTEKLLSVRTYSADKNQNPPRLPLCRSGTRAVEEGEGDWNSTWRRQIKIYSFLN